VQDDDAIKAYPFLCNNIIAMTDKVIVIIQNCLGSQKDGPGSHSEACASSHSGVHAVNIKIEEFSDIEDREDPAPMTVLGIKAEYEVSCMSLVSIVRHLSVTSRIAGSLSSVSVTQNFSSLVKR
jgi:hypothetical protein